MKLQLNVSLSAATDTKVNHASPNRSVTLMMYLSTCVATGETVTYQETQLRWSSFSVKDDAVV